jgi:valyl-tRNA synthetase
VLAEVAQQATAAFEAFNYTKALEVTETFFWSFCDDHLELVKDRAYGLHGDAAATSAKAALSISLKTMLKLFAPFLPFVTEEVWSWWQEGSIHLSAWPTSQELEALGGNTAVVDVAAEVLSGLRKVKSEAKVSMKAGLRDVTISASAQQIELIKLVARDLCAAGRVEGEFSYEVADGHITLSATLVPAE